MQLEFHFRIAFAVVAAVLMACLCPPMADAARIPGVTATTTMGNGFATNLQNTVNAVGLSAPTLTATHAGSAPNNSWVSIQGVLAGSVTFDLHASLVVTGFSFWNQNGGGPGASGTTGIRNVTISYSTDGVTFQPVSGAPPQFNQISTIENAAPQVITFPGVLATHLRFQILSNYGDVDQTGFSEVAFNGGPNQPPTIIAPETITMEEDVAANFTVTTMDPEGDPDEPPSAVFSTPAKGTITGTRTNFTYTPNLNVNGSDSFTITAEDPHGGVTTRTMNVTITSVNDLPVFVSAPEALACDEDTSVVFNVAATDVESEVVTFSFAGAAKGVISSEGGGYRYTPHPNVNGADTFTIRANDGDGGTALRTVSVTLAPINDAPVFTFVPETLTTHEDNAFPFHVSGSDVDGDTVVVTISHGQKGTVTRSGSSFTYTPALNLNGSDSFVASISDGQGGTASATVNVTIVPVNDAPAFTFIPATIRTSEDAETNFTITTSDVENDVVTVAFSDSSKGTVSGDGPSYTYTPNPGVAGIDTFTVTATDGQGGITIRGVNVRIVGAPTIAGRYALLLADESGVHASLALILSRRGFISGLLREENGQTERFHRTVKLPPGERSATIQFGNRLSLALEFDSKGHVAATLTSSTRVLHGTGNVGVPPPASVPGRYTMVLDTGSGGFGWCVMVVTPRGSVRISGRLPDGSTISASQGVPIDGDNNAPLFLLGKRREIPVLSGSIHFATEIESDVTGALTFRAGTNTVSCEANGAQFVPASSALPAGTYPLAVIGEGVNISSNLTLNNDNTAIAESPLISFTPGGGAGRPANGLFSVGIRETPGRGGSRAPTLLGSGVFVQKQGKGFGQFIKNGVTGQVLIGEQP